MMNIEDINVKTKFGDISEGQFFVKGGRAQRAAFGQTGAHLSIDNLYNFQVGFCESCTIAFSP